MCTVFRVIVLRSILYEEESEDTRVIFPSSKRGTDICTPYRDAVQVGHLPSGSTSLALAVDYEIPSGATF